VIFSTRNDTAINGKNVMTTVEILEEVYDKPWRVIVAVDYIHMYHSHHEIRSLAEAKADAMHKTYLSVHATK